MEGAFVKKLENQIQLKDFKLNSLLDITNAINTNQNVSKLIPKSEYKASGYVIIIIQR